MFTPDEESLLNRFKDDPVGCPFGLTDQELQRMFQAVKRERGTSEAQARRVIRVWVAKRFKWPGRGRAHRNSPRCQGEEAEYPLDHRAEAGREAHGLVPGRASDVGRLSVEHCNNQMGLGPILTPEAAVRQIRREKLWSWPTQRPSASKCWILLVPR